MSRDVITVGLTMRISLLYRGEYSQWRERFMNYLEEQTDGETMIKSIQNGDQPLPVVAPVSLAGTAQTASPTLKDPKFWTAEEKKTQKIDRLARSLLIQGLPNDIYSLIESNETTKDLWDALERKMHGSEYGEQDRKAAILKFYSKPTNNKLRTSSTSQSANKKQEFVKSDEKKEDKKANEKKRDMSKVKCYNCKKQGHFAKDCKKAKIKDYNYYKTKMLLAKKDNDEQVLLAKDQAWMESNSDESSSSAKETIAELAYYTSESESESEFQTSKYYDNSTNYGLFVNNDDDQEIFHDAIESASENFIKNHINSQKDYDKSDVNHNDSEAKEHLVDNLIWKFNHKITKCQKPKDLRPSLYDEKVIGLGYTPMFLIHSDEALEIEMFKRARKNKIEFAYDYGNLNASYVNEKINFSDDYFQEILNPDFEKIDFPFQQTSSLKPYVPNVILEKIIIDLEDEVVSLLEKEKANLKTIESLKSKGFESIENAISESENQSENDCHVIEKECDKVENPKVIAPGMFKLSVSQSVSPISMLKTSCDSKNVENLDTFSSVRRPNVTPPNWVAAEYETGALCDSYDENNLFIFDDKSVRISPVSKMPFRKKLRDSMNIVQNCLWIIDSGCLKHMTGSHALLISFVDKFLGTVRFGNNDFAVIAGYRDVVIGSMTIKKVYYVEGLGHNLFSVEQFYDKGLEVAFRKSTCFVRNEDGVDFLTGDRLSNLYTTTLNEVASNSSTCILAKASCSQSWLWHQHLSHLNFSIINNLVKNNLVQDLPKMKFKKDHLCFACEQGKIHQKHHKSKTDFASNKPLYLLYMDLCGPMRVESINRKRYVLVVVDDYSRFTWVFFLHSKDEASEVIISFIKKT
nr:ribonuclease H-like domain-containing protein [Tanacetum cinerariifolium]